MPSSASLRFSSIPSISIFEENDVAIGWRAEVFENGENPGVALFSAEESLAVAQIEIARMVKIVTDLEPPFS